MISVNDDFTRVVECEYKGERYLVRDNGAIMRIGRLNGGRRKLDYVWTFGRPNKYGYLTIRSELIHRIAATAFHGAPSSPNHVVDHIDTNRQNNRPENLRWLTPIENILSNPVTLSRIIYRCGSIEAFLDNPSILSDEGSDFSWMRTVTSTEAKNALDNLMRLSQMKPVSEGGAYDDWIYARKYNDYKILSLKHQNTLTYIGIESMIRFREEMGFDMAEPYERLEFDLSGQQMTLLQSINKNALQLGWTSSCHFLLCPESVKLFPILDYYTSIEKDLLFLERDYGAYYVEKASYNKILDVLFVLCRVEVKQLKPHSLWTVIAIGYRKNSFVHEKKHFLYYREDAEKSMEVASSFVFETWVYNDVFSRRHERDGELLSSSHTSSLRNNSLGIEETGILFPD